MWQPDPGWEPLPGGRGPATLGQWRARDHGATVIVKRVRRPAADESGLLDPAGTAYWRRELEVAVDHEGLRGLVPPEVVRVEEDDEGYCIWTVEVPGPRPTALFVASALARLLDSSWPTGVRPGRGTLADRIRMMEAHDGWPTLARTPFADLAARLWRQRGSILRRYAELPGLPAHGDVVPANLVGTTGSDVVAVDWATFGSAPAGADLGYFSLSCREDFEALSGGYLHAPQAVGLAASQVLFAARAMAVYTVVARAEWALSRAAAGEGPLASRYRHPSVAPHLRALQRQLPQVEALLAT